MTYNNLQDNNNQGIELNATMITYGRERMNASVVNIADEREKREEVIQGKADISGYSIENIKDGYIEIPVGDMERDNVQPPQAAIKVLEERRSYREKLKGIERTGTDR